MQQKETQLKTHILNKKITDIEFYNINDNYFVFDPESTWVFDGGIQIKFDNEVFSFGWNNAERGFDYSIENTLEDFFGDLDTYPIEAKKIEGANNLIGLEILDLEIEWGFYREYDENFELKDEKIYMPVGLLFKFSDNKFLNVALIKFAVTKDPFKIVNAQYDLDGGLYISLNNDLEIAKIETE